MMAQAQESFVRAVMESEAMLQSAVEAVHNVRGRLTAAKREAQQVIARLARSFITLAP